MEDSVDEGSSIPSVPQHDESQLFRMALGAAHAVAWVWDIEADVLAWFGDAKDLYGFDNDATSGPSDTFLRAVHPDDQHTVVDALDATIRHGAEFEVEYRSVHDDGTVRWHRTKGTVVLGAGGRVTRMLGVATDVTDRREVEERLAHLAVHDPLTDLPNRTLLLDRLGLALDRQARQPGLLAVLFVDLDGFKGVNDRHGHEAGDQVLVTTAARLRSAVRPADTVARLGGDEFVVVAELSSRTEATGLAARLVTKVGEPHELGGTTVVCPASVGLQVAGPDSTPASLLRDADAAMYRVKGTRTGTSRWVTDDRATET